MPIQIYDAQAPNTPTAPVTVSTVSTAGTQQAGATLENIYSSMQETFDTEALASAQVEYARGLSEIEAKYQSDTDYQTAPQRYDEDVKTLRENMSQGMSQRVSSRFTPWAELKGIGASTAFTAANSKKFRQHRLASGKSNEDFLANKIVGADGGQARGMAWAEAAIYWEARKGLYDNELQWANAYEEWRDNTTFSAMLSDLDKTGGIGFRPDPNLSPDQNRQAQTYAQTLINSGLREAEKQEKVVAMELEQRQDAYLFHKIAEMSNPPEGYKPWTLADVENDLRAGRLSLEGAEKARQILTGSGAPTSREGLFEAQDAYDNLSRELITKEQYQTTLRNLLKNNSIEQSTYESYSAKVQQLEDGYMREAEGLLSNVYRPSQMDQFDAWKDKKAFASAQVSKIYREQGGKAARDYVRELAKTEMMNVGKPNGYTGKMTIDGLQKYREEVRARYVKFLADTGTKFGEDPSNADDRSKANEMKGIIKQIDDSINRINDLEGVLQ